MQKTEPDYEAAVTAFERTLKVDDFDLRQESLANLAWCLYQQGIAVLQSTHLSSKNPFRSR